jgi:methionyl-tRNA synthetase
MKRTLITSALPYASGVTHLGNVVGSTLPADIYARYCRLRGRPTLSICGSDEHGVAITIAAEKEGITPKQLVDRFHALNAGALQRLGIEFDHYGRTSDAVHIETAQEFFTAWLEKGLLSEREEEQFFDADANMFLPDRYVEGICPNCSYDRARGDQCDNCGAYYNQLDLREPKSLVSGKKPEVRKTKHWFFRLDTFQEWIEKYVESHGDTWKDNVLQQSRSWLKPGLAERAATRDMAWGIPVPAPDANGKVIYVWFEAVLGYISITKEWARITGQPDAWRQWWCDNETSYTAFLGKDNIVFHTIIFPILLSTREGYILPEHVPANEFLNLEGQKFSKSRNWAIDVLQYLAAFPEAQHVDILRYVLTMNMPETRDSDFTWKDFQARTNNELAAILGNYVNRVMTFAQKNFNGAVPAIPDGTASGEHEDALRFAVEQGLRAVADHYDRYRFRDAATETMNIARAANKYFNDKAPWKSIKTDAADCALAVNTCLQLIRTLAVAVAPILPRSAEQMLQVVGERGVSGAPGEIPVGVDAWMQAAEHVLPAGRSLGEPVILFTKIEDDVVEREVSKLGERTTENTARSNKNVEQNADEQRIDISTFQQVQLRTAVILEAERVPKSKKLVKLQVDMGTEKRQVLAGIAEHYEPEALIGKTVVVVANLQPAKLMGLESQGMILAASNDKGELTLVSPLSDIGPGVTVK